MDAVLRRFTRGIVALIAALAALASSPAQAQEVSEPAVKAAYLYKFGGYLEWPASAAPRAEAPFTIGVQGADDVAAELARLVPGRMVQGRRLEVRRVRDVDGLKGVQVLFVGRAEANPRDAVRAATRLGIVTVTDADRGLELGSTIAFVASEDRVAFEVSLPAADRVGVTISSRMLGVARRVVPKG